MASLDWRGWLDEEPRDINPPSGFYEHDSLVGLVDHKTIGMNLGRYYAELGR